MFRRWSERIIFHYLLLIITFFSIQCSGETAIEYCRRVTNEGLYEFSLPCSWEISEPNKYTISATEESTNNKLKTASIMLLVQFMPREVSEDEYLTISKQQLLEKYSDVKFKNIYSTTISGYNGRCIEVEYTEDQDRLFSLSAFAVSSNTALVFVAISPIDKAKTMAAIFKKVLSSIHFDNSKKKPTNVEMGRNGDG